MIASIPESVANLNRLHIHEIEVAMINHAQQESVDAYIDRLQSVKHTVVNAERVRISAKLNSCLVPFFVSLAKPLKVNPVIRNGRSRVRLTEIRGLATFRPVGDLKLGAFARFRAKPGFRGFAGLERRNPEGALRGGCFPAMREPR